MAKTIVLKEFGITVNLDGKGNGDITSGLQEECPRCSNDILVNCTCTDDLRDEDNENRENYNIAMDGIESLILAHACAGINISAPAYLKGIRTAIDACGHNFS